MIFSLVLLGSKNTLASMLFAGIFTATIAIAADFHVKHLIDLADLVTFIIPLVILVTFGGLCSMFLGKYLYEFIDQLERNQFFGPISLNGWYCYGTAAIIALSSSSYNPDPQTKRGTVPTSVIVLHTTITLLILSTALLVCITKIIL